MTVNLSMLAGAGAQFFDNNGDPLSGGKVYTYAAGTTTPQATYTTSAGNVAHANPIVLDSAGRVPSGGEIWLTDTVSYKFVLSNSTGTTIGTYDNLTGNGSGILPALTASGGSSFVGFIQSGTSATARTVQDKLRETVSVKDFGAVGNGVTNDTDAFAAASAYITTLGGGTLIIPPGTYIVGKQVFAGQNGLGYSYKGQKILDFFQCSKPVRVIGDGAILRLAPGLKFGSFDPVTGAVYNPPSMPFTNTNYVASTVDLAVIAVRQCTGLIEIVGLEIDGNNSNLTLGGTWGDTGRQIVGTGIRTSLCDNVAIRNCYIHDHALDGITISETRITNETIASKPHFLENVISNYNARQGLSIVGGKGITCIRCQFNHTGRGTFSSSPAAGVDIEPNTGLAYDITFNDCEFVNNVGTGLIHDQTDKAYNVTLNSCTLWGTTNWSLWMRASFFVANNCKIYGSIVNCVATAADTQPEKAAKFRGCLFEDRAYLGVPAYGGCFQLATGHYGVKFENCDFVSSYSRMGNAYSSSSGTATPANCIQFTDCRFRFMDDTQANKSYQVIFRGCGFLRCVFSESYTTPPADGYYIEESNTFVQDGVYLATTYTRWNSWSPGAGWTGPIPQSQGHTNTYQLLLQRFGGITAQKLQRDTAIPSTGTYNRGDIVLYTSPSAGDYIGAVCVTAGTPGTWKEFGAILA